MKRDLELRNETQGHSEVANPSGNRKWKPCTYEAARVGPFLFYQTSALLKTWFLSSWGLCEESLGCYWHCQAQGFLARERQINCCKTQKRKNCSFWCTITRHLSFRSDKKEEQGNLECDFFPYAPSFFSKLLKCIFLGSIGLQIFSRKKIALFCSRHLFFPSMSYIPSN